MRAMKIMQQHKRHGAADWQAMTRWFATPLGQFLLQRERACVQELLRRRFGYHLLELGCAETLLHDLSPMGHRFSFCPHAIDKTLHSALACGEAIPLGAESVDLVLLHHALDFSDHQHQLLREVARVLIAGGSVVIVGFNPVSTWGLRSLLPPHRPGPWNASLLGTRRLGDWLQLLDFQIDQLHYGAYVLPVNSERCMRWSGHVEPLASRLHWPTGGVYVIHARKQVIPLTPIQGRWRRLPVPGIAMPLADQVGRSQPVEKTSLDP